MFDRLSFRMGLAVIGGCYPPSVGRMVKVGSHGCLEQVLDTRSSRVGEDTWAAILSWEHCYSEDHARDGQQPEAQAQRHPDGGRVLQQRGLLHGLAWRPCELTKETACLVTHQYNAPGACLTHSGYSISGCYSKDLTS